MFWCDIENKVSNTSAFKHHEKCHNPDKKPACHSSTNSTYERYTSTRERWNLSREKWLDISSILFDDIQRTSDVLFTEEQYNNLFNIWVYMKSGNTLFKVYFLSGVNPIDNYIDGITQVCHDDWYKCSDDDTCQYENQYIYSNDCHPWWDFSLFPFFCKRIYENGQKSRYYKSENKRSEYIENIESECN